MAASEDKTAKPFHDGGTVQMLESTAPPMYDASFLPRLFAFINVLQTPETCPPYAAAKLAAEQDCLASTRDLGPESVCLRYFNVFGSRQPASSPDWRGILPILHALCTDHRPVIHGSGTEPFDVIHVDDVVHATLLAAETARAAGRMYDIGRGCATTMLDMVKVISAISGVELQPLHTSNGPTGEPPCLANLANTEAELGFCPTVSLEQGLRSCIADYTVHLRASLSPQDTTQSK